MSAILVLGATGASGQAFVQQALARDPNTPLVLYVRSPSKLPAEWRDNKPNIKISVGELTDDAVLEDAMKGVKAVACFLGAYASLTNLVTRSRVTPIGDSLPHAFKAMRAHRVKRIIALSTPSSCVLPDDKWSWTWWSAITFPDVVVPQGHAEMSKIAEMVSAQDDFDWTVFRVMFLTNGSAENTVHAASVLTPDFPGSTTISRASFGRWVLDEIASPKHIKDKPVLGN